MSCLDLHVDEVDAIGGPGVVDRVELEEDQEGEEDTGYSGDVRSYQEVSRGQQKEQERDKEKEAGIKPRSKRSRTQKPSRRGLRGEVEKETHLVAIVSEYWNWKLLMLTPRRTLLARKRML